MDTNSLKDLFDKYVLVWIWSIFISINTALSYNIFNLYSTSNWGRLGVFLIPIYFMSVAMALVSWLSLFNFFRVKILTLILWTDPDEPEWLENSSKRIETGKKRKEDDYFAYRQLRNSFMFIIFAIFFRFLIPVIEMFFNLFYNHSN